MRSLLLLFALFCLINTLSAQYVYTIKADSVKLTSCDSSELIVENHTQNVAGFLFNTGNGRTVFKKGVLKINDSFYLIGADTLKVPSTAWLQGGNRFGTTGVLGTLDSNHLDFYTNGVQRTRLTSAGDLLLGSTVDNGYKLDVTGQVSLNNGAGSFIITSSTNELSIAAPAVVDLNTPLLRTFNGTDLSSIYFSAAPGSAIFKNPTGPFLFDIVGGSSLLRIHPYGDGSGITEINNYGTGFYPFLKIISPVQFSSASPVTGYNYLFSAGGGGGQAFAIQDSSLHDKFLVNGTTGNVLINKDTYYGGSDDGHTFQVNGSSSFDDSLVLNRVIAGTSADSVLVWNASSHAVHKISQSSLGSAFNGILNSSLAVNGTISAQRLRLSQAGWPDYVFDRSYHLPDLHDIEQYIRQHGHLPGIPSAKEVEKKGIDVGNQQAALLRKIEELTLYNIAQEKALKEQNQKLETQAGEIGSLKQEMMELKKMMANKTKK